MEVAFCEEKLIEASCVYWQQALIAGQGLFTP